MDLHDIFQGRHTDYKWRMLGEYLKGNQINAGKGIKIENSSSSGSIISAIPAREKNQSQAPPFSVTTLRKIPEQSQYAAELQEGWVIMRDTQNGSDAVKFYEVNIGSSPMSTRPRPEITLSHDDFVMVKYTTDEEGHVTGTPIIEVGAEQDSVHHNPASGAGTGSGGTYYVKIFKFTLSSGAPVLTVYQQSDIEHTRLWAGRNVGGARYIHKDWDKDADRYDFRTLEQFVPTGNNVPDYGKVIVDAVGDEDLDTNDAIKFSCLAEKDESPQVNVNDDGAGTITIEGNNKSGSLVWAYCEADAQGNTQETLLEWEDGLITTQQGGTITAGCGSGLPSGSSGDILYYNGSTWVTLAKPATTNANGEGYVLTHVGGSTVAPDWTPYDSL